MRLFLVLLGLAQLAHSQPPPATGLVERLAALPDTAERRRWIEAEHVEMTPELLKAFIDRGNTLANQHSFADAEQWDLLALGYAEQQQSTRLEAQTLSRLAELYGQTNKYEKALDCAMRSVGLARRIGDQPLTGIGLAQLSAIQSRLGDLDEAISAARESLAVAEAARSPAVESVARSALANALQTRGDYRAALEQHLKALENNRSSGYRGNEAVELGNIAALYTLQRDFDLAVDYYQRSLPLAEQVGFRITQARFLSNLAGVYVEIGNYPLAEDYARRALGLARRLNHSEILAHSLSILSVIDWHEYRRAEAIEKLDQAVAVLDQIGNKDILTPLLPGLGVYRIEIGDVERGFAVLDRARALALDLGDRATLYAACTLEGRSYLKLNRPAEARARLAEAIAAAESLRGDVAGGAIAQQGFFADKLDPYHEMVELADREGSVDKAFQFAEQSRTLALLDALRGGHVSLTRAMTGGERRQEFGLRQRAAGLNREMAKAREDGGAVHEIEARLKRSRLDQAEFERALYAAHPELCGQRLEGQPASLAAVSALLPDRGTALLEYVVTEERTFLFVVSKNSRPLLLRIPITGKALTATVERLANQIATRSLDYRPAAQELEKLLIEPARPALGQASTLIVVADGPLWRLPFAVLESPGGEPLIERFALFYAPSATALRELVARRKGGLPRSILAVGNPPGANLPGVEKEMAALGELYGPANARVLTGADATETSFKSNAGRYDVLHIASHGVVDNENPLYSYLSLARGGSDDGFLEAREMAEMDLKAQLVVLSACETARGKSGGGEGVIGMTWALFLAGSPATVASAWKADDEATFRIMLELHRALRRGDGKAAALRSASLAVRRDERYQHPFYWAAFSLYGNGF